MGSRTRKGLKEVKLDRPNLSVLLWNLVPFDPCTWLKHPLFDHMNILQAKQCYWFYVLGFFNQSVRLMCRLNTDACMVFCVTFRAERLLYLQQFLLLRQSMLPVYLKSKSTRVSVSVLMFKTGMFAKLLQPGWSWALTDTISLSPVHSAKHLVSLSQHFWVHPPTRPTLSVHKYTEMCLCLTSVRRKLSSLGCQPTESSVGSASRATLFGWKAAACCTASDGPCELSAPHTLGQVMCLVGTQDLEPILWTDLLSWWLALSDLVPNNLG